jgi:hypothetical protein
MAFQFVHIESYSRKSDKHGRSVGFVLAEAARRPDACQHVATPGTPTVVLGESVDGVRALHDARVDQATETTKAGKCRKIRSDQHTLLTVIASHPATTEEMRADPARAADVDAWQARVVDWLRSQWGDDLVSVIRHDDEAHPHLHAYVLPSDPQCRARRLHPGVVAKEAATAVAATGGADPKTTNKIGDDAYRRAMRGMQDSYWNHVGLPSGQARLGPGRRRLTRAGWQAEKTAAAAAATALRAVELAEVTTSTAQAKAADLGDRGRAFVVKAREAAAAARASAAAALASLKEAEEAEVRIRKRVGSVSALLEEVQGIRTELVQERTARRVAEVERERYRGMWAEADNRLHVMERGHRR